MNEVIYFLGMRLEYWTLLLAIIAIAFTALKDFILPRIFKPELNITYKQKEPYVRQTVITSGSNTRSYGFFHRFKIKNVGKVTAKNCRCQVYSVKDKKGKQLDLTGFPIRWASRPESMIDFTKAERLNIGPGESEFVDLVNVDINQAGYFYFQPYHIPIGMNPQVKLDDYIIKIIISGDNFKPYFATFEMNGNPKEKHILDIVLKRVTRLGKYSVFKKLVRSLRIV